MLFSRRFPFLSIFRFKRWRFLAIAIAALSSILISWVVMAQQPVTLRLLMTAPDAQPWQAAMVSQFEEKYPNIRIEIVEGPNATNLIEDLYTSAFLLGDSPYDLVNMDVIWTPKFAAAGWLVDITDRVTPEQLAGFSQVDIEGGKYNDRLYRMPLRSDAGVFYYRSDLLEKHNLQPPETFDELMQQSKILQESGDVPWGYVWQGRQYEGLAAMFVEVLAGFGGFWVNPDTLEVGLDRPETIQAINWLRSTVSEGVSPPGVTTYQEEETRRFFQSGQAAFLRSWPYVVPLANAEDSPIRGKVGIKAMVHAQGQESGACLGGWGLAISKSSRHQEEAWEAVKFFSSVEPQRNYILEAGYVPSRKVLFSDREVVEKFPHYPQLLEIVQTAVLRPPIAQYAQASDILQRYLSAALTNRMSPEDAMRAAANETRTLLKT